METYGKEIQEAFQKLREESDASIRARVNDTRNILLEHLAQKTSVEPFFAIRWRVA